MPTANMPGAAVSSWYFLRFCDPHNDRELCRNAASDYWMPVDLYAGGTEHAVGHLLYSRFWNKVRHDDGFIHCDEPFRKLFNQGMILSFAYRNERGAAVATAEVEDHGDGRYTHRDTGAELEQIFTKMSKRYGNVVNPDDVVREYGADTLRLYEMYMGPLADPKPWNPKDVPGVHRFLGRAWRLCVPEDWAVGSFHARSPTSAHPTPSSRSASIAASTRSPATSLAFNTAISAMMVFVNEATKRTESLCRSQMLRFVQTLSPFAPHVAEELWQRLGGEGLLAYSHWPEVDQALLVDDTVQMVVQVLGKVRGQIRVAQDAPQAEVIAAAKEAAAKWLDGKVVVKEIVVPGRLVNLVVR